MSRQGSEALDTITARGKVEGEVAGNIRLDGIETVEDIRKPNDPAPAKWRRLNSGESIA